MRLGFLVGVYRETESRVCVLLGPFLDLDDLYSVRCRQDPRFRSRTHLYDYLLIGYTVVSSLIPLRGDSIRALRALSHLNRDRPEQGDWKLPNGREVGRQLGHRERELLTTRVDGRRSCGSCWSCPKLSLTQSQ